MFDPSFHQQLKKFVQIILLSDLIFEETFKTMNIRIVMNTINCFQKSFDSQLF